jgi:hypothetical protein
MKKIGSQTRATLKEAGMKLINRPAKGQVILQDIETGKKELWCVNNCHAGYTIQVGRWGYEFERNWTFAVPLYDWNK